MIKVGGSTEENVEKYMGKKVFYKNRLHTNKPARIATGLVSTAMGGETVFIECVWIEKSEVKPFTLKVTGQWGDVMKDSADISLYNDRNYLTEFHGKNELLKSCMLHMLVLEGTTPKGRAQFRVHK